MTVSRRSALRSIASAALGAVSLGAAGLLITETAEGQSVVGTRHRMRRRTRRRTRRRMYALPAGHTTTVVAGTPYYVVEGVTYEAVMEQGDVVYVEVIDD